HEVGARGVDPGADVVESGIQGVAEVVPALLDVLVCAAGLAVPGRRHLFDQLVHLVEHRLQLPVALLDVRDAGADVPEGTPDLVAGAGCHLTLLKTPRACCLRQRPGSSSGSSPGSGRWR